MNERIEKLFEHVRVNEHIERIAKESDCVIDRLGYGEGNLEKFAELIVQECISIAEAGVAPAVVTVIKERFGVEEIEINRT